MVKVRFAPSPTGNLHIGGARTALYNYLYASAMRGEFIIRMEDTDKARSSKESMDSILDDLRWLGFYHGKPISLQSNRHGLYMDYANILVDKDKVYKGDDGAWYIRNPNKTYTIQDQVLGEVSWHSDSVGDFIIMRPDTSAVYHFACVIDDWKQGITHVIRGADHLNNTPKQLMIFDALGVEPPTYAHCSLLVGEDNKKYSKRHGATSVKEFRKQGYLREALLNYLYLLGASHPDGEIFTSTEIGFRFDFPMLTKSPSKVDLVKLNHVNAQHIKRMGVYDAEKEFDKYIDLARYRLCKNAQQWTEQFVALFQDRLTFFKDIVTEGWDKVLFDADYSEGEEAEKARESDSYEVVRGYLEEDLRDISRGGTRFVTADHVDGWLFCLKAEGFKGRELFLLLRVALTRQVQGPDLKLLTPLIPLDILRERVKHQL